MVEKHEFRSFEDDWIGEIETEMENPDCLSYIFIVSEEYKDYTFDYDDMAG